MEMALRSQTLFVGLALAQFAAAADFPVSHVNCTHDRPGTLSVTADGVEFKETKRQKHPHDFHWTWNDIQRLTLFPNRLEITTYKDVKWLLGRDREFTFTGKDLDAAYPLLHGPIPRRLVAEIARTAFEVTQRLPAKRLEGRAGFEGTLLFGPGRIVFESETLRGSHTWMIEDVDNVSTSDPLELTVSSLGTDYRLQLKRPLPESLYQSLWRAVNLEKKPL
jgi:hypothetical protein